MRHLLYGSAAGAMMGAALVLALLPRVTMDPLWFFLVGGSLTATIGGGWVVAGAVAGDWPRPRTGWMLLIAGFIGVAVSLWSWTWYSFVWAMAVWVHGLLFTFPVLRRGRRPEPGTKGGPVRPPVSRRQEGS